VGARVALIILKEAERVAMCALGRGLGGGRGRALSSGPGPASSSSAGSSGGSGALLGRAVGLRA